MTYPNLIKQTKEYIYSKSYQNAASFLEEKTDQIRLAVSYILPVTLAVINNESQSKRVATEIYTKITSVKFNNASISELQDVFLGKNSLILEESSHAIDTIFESNLLKDICKLISDKAKIHPASVNSLFKMLVPFIFRAINEQIKTDSLNIYEFVELIKNQKDSCEELSKDFLKQLSNQLDLKICAFDQNNQEHITVKENEHATPKKKLILFLMFVGAIALGVLCSHLFFDTSNTSTDVNLVNTPKSSDEHSLHKESITNSPEVIKNTLTNFSTFYKPNKSDIGKFISGREFLGNFVERTLKDNSKIIILSKGGLNKFIDYVEQGRPVSKQAWFDINRIKVLKEKGTIDFEKSKQGINDLFVVLKAYPNIHIKIGGLTDNEGPSLANFNLSHKFSEIVMKELIKLGIKEERLQFEGYGENYPVLSNETEEARLFNQRISIRLTKK